MSKIPPRFDMSIRVWKGIRARDLIYLVPAGCLALGCLLLPPWPILLRLLGSLGCVVLGITGAFLKLQGLGVSKFLLTLSVFLARPRERVWRRGKPLLRPEVAFGEAGALWQRLLLAGIGLLAMLLALLLLWPSKEQVVAAVVVPGPTPTLGPTSTPMPTPSSPMVDVDEITSKEWYLADGDTRSSTEREDYDTWVLLMNPQETVSRVAVEFIPTAGERLTCTYDLPPQSRTNIWVDQIMPERQMSTIVQASSPIMAERALFWGGRGGHSTHGCRRPGGEWYFADAVVSQKEKCFLIILNPSDQEAHLRLRFLRQGVLGTSEGVLAPRSVMRLDVSTFGLPSGPVALILESDVGVVAERSAYQERGGHSTAGANEPSKEWYFAEGNVAGGKTHFAVLNPTPNDARVFFHFYMELEEREEEVQLEVSAYSRVILRAEEVSSLVGAFATVVRASAPIVVERAMYTQEGYGHSTIGLPAPQKVWYLAEGCSDWPYTNYTYIFNPGRREAAVQVVMMDDEGQLRTLSGDIPPYGRWVIYANEVWTTLFSTKVVSSEPVVCERVMAITKGGVTSSLGISKREK